ncbi:hypothetical protein NQ317_010658 [Molorchus minor]|uniref:Ribosomal RNA-processing protein 42 n=1 Tax=Molorchus minor TaxID=1323400 RepID=A0ABQ9K7A4_9CUCU|nr:hypothetical protein NQ317_010658 [Molorchus minor]
MALCEAEKTFVLHGVEENFRIDGREREDYRPMELETDIVSHAFGSARLRLANTDVLVAVKIEVDTPFPERPFEGKLEFFVDCSANATPDFEGRGGEGVAIEISNTLSAAYSSPNVFDLKKLCILKGKKCWKVYVDILLLECGGNLFDAVSLAVKAALWNTQVPLVKQIDIDGNNVEIKVSEELYDCRKLDVEKAPILVTVCKIGEHCIVDPNVAEEQCSVGSVVVAVSEDKFSTILQTGTGSLHMSTLVDCLQLGIKVAQRLDAALWDTLTLECYTCSTTEDESDTTCLDNPSGVVGGVTDCDKKYCIIVRVDYKDPRGKLASILRSCVDKPTYTNDVIEDETHRVYYRSCRTAKCNGGSGRSDSTSDDNGSLGDKSTIYCPGIGDGAVAVTVSFSILLFAYAFVRYVR